MHTNVRHAALACAILAMLLGWSGLARARGPLGLGGRGGGLLPMPGRGGRHGGSLPDHGPDLPTGPPESDRFMQTFPMNEAIELQTWGRHRGDTFELELRFNEAPRGGCTFGQVYLEDAQQRRIFPYRIKILERWQRVKVTVSWSRTKYVDGQEVWHEEGSYSNCYSWLVDRKVTTEQEGEGAVLPDPIWQRLGFPSPQGGARKILVTFKLPEEEADNLPAWDVHVVGAHVVKRGLFRKENVEVPTAFTLAYHAPPAETLPPTVVERPDAVTEGVEDAARTVVDETPEHDPDVVTRARDVVEEAVRTSEVPDEHEPEEPAAGDEPSVKVEDDEASVIGTHPAQGGVVSPEVPTGEGVPAEGDEPSEDETPVAKVPPETPATPVETDEAADIWREIELTQK